MIDRIPAALAPDLVRTPPWLTKSINGRSWCGLALACLLLAGCAGAGASPPLASGEETSPPKADPALALAAAAGSGAASAGAVAADPALLQRRRQTIAAMLEGNIAYRTLFDVKLINAKLAGPFQIKKRNFLFSSETHTETLYCASADFDVPWIHAVRRNALIRVGQSSNGSERLYARIPLNYYPPECGDAKYGPFPEMEQLRAKRRKALGKSD